MNILKLTLATAMALMAHVAVAQVPQLPPAPSIVFSFPAGTLNAPWAYTRDGRIQGFAVNPAAGVWSVMNDGTDYVLRPFSSFPDIELTFANDSNNQNVVENGQGAMYGIARPRSIGGTAAGTTCPFVRSAVDGNGQFVTEANFSQIFKYSSVDPVRVLPISSSAQFCSRTRLTIDRSDNVYFVSKYDAVNIPSIPAEYAIYRLSSNEQSLTRIRDLTIAEVGNNPYLLLAGQDGASIYGINRTAGQNGGPVLFRTSVDGSSLQVLRHFTPGTDGSVYGTGNAQAQLVEIGDYLYGLMGSGGPSNGGTLFRVGKGGDGSDFRILHAFQSGMGRPVSMVVAGDGNIYGTTAQGGANSAGALFRIVPALITASDSGVEPLIHSFSGDANIDGGSGGRLMTGHDGKVYGHATQVGGAGGIFKLDVPVLQPAVALAPNPTQVTWTGTAGQEQSTLTWTVENAVSCVASGDWSGAKSVAGGSEQMVPVREGDNTYTLTCDNGSGLPSGTTVRTATVRAVAPPPPVAINSFSASPTTVVAGGATTLSWVTQNAISCRPSWTGSNLDATQLASGSAEVTVDSSAGERTYSLTCQGQANGDEQTRVAGVTVTAAPGGGDDGGIDSTRGGGPLSAWLLLPLAGLALLRRRPAVATARSL